MRALLLLSMALAAACPVAKADSLAWKSLSYAPAPVDNPLKGLVPYAGARNPDRFPHSMEFRYFPLGAVMKGPDNFDWTILDAYLDDVASRGHQAVFRFYTEFPNRTDGVPEFLIKDGLRLTAFSRKQTPPRPYAVITTPDYSNPAFRAALVRFIAALGKRYDGDPRIGYITAGLLGIWGEWHDSPRAELFAKPAVQQEVMNAYQAAFHTTPILLRYPSAGTPAYAANASRPFGYHDDSFAWSTLGPRTYQFVPLLKAADALDKWKTQPIGGEIRPEAWGIVFDAKPANPKVQDFRACVEATHVTWLMDSGLFREANPPERRERALTEVRRMGYEFQVTRAALEPATGHLRVHYELTSRGVAPFYYAWPVEVALLSSDGRLVSRQTTHESLAHLLPGAQEQRSIDLSLKTLPAGRYRVLLGVPNPLPRGHPVGFANAEWSRDLPGWLTLGEVELP